LKLVILPVTVAYAERQSTLPPYHKDPLDRLMIAQALADDLSVVSVDAQFDAYGVKRLW
jgi:PIN domain nuclease of toxin-antitoxin system